MLWYYFINLWYNSLVGEIAIFIASILTHGSRIYPKYNKNAYMIKNVDSTNYKLTEKCEFDIIDAINNMEESKESIIKFSSYLLDFIAYMIEEGKEQ